MTTRANGVEEMTLAFLGCRDKGHHWVFLTDEITEGSKRTIREITRRYLCDGCKTEMEEAFAIPSCEVRSRRYRYPDGYLLAPEAFVGRRLSVRDVRREVFGRSGYHF